MDTLSTAWSPVLTIKSALISLQGLLASPEPKDPQDAEVAGMLLKNKDEFEHVAHEWAIKHAGAPSKDKAESSGGATAEDVLKKAQEAKKGGPDTKPDAYVDMGCRCISCTQMLIIPQASRIPPCADRALHQHGLRRG